MENPNNHHENDEEILEVELNINEEEPIHDSDASGYEWEREMQDFWEEANEAFNVVVA